MKSISILDLSQAAMQSKSTNNVGKIIAAALLPVFTLFFFGPILIFITNADQFAIGLSSLLPMQLLLAIAMLAGLALLLIVIPNPAKSIFMLLVTAVGFLAWLQGQVIVWQYGILDGTGIEWSRHLVKGVVDGTIWAVTLAAVMAFRRRLWPWIGRISLLLVLIQAGALFLLFVKDPSVWKAKPEPGLVINRYRFSSEKNVIILILDEFQSDVFSEIIRQEPKLSLQFDGFTHFQDCVGSYSNTAASVPFIMTGRYSDNSEPHSLFIRRSYMERSIPKVLWATGFRLDMYPRTESINLVQLPKSWLETQAKGSLSREMLAQSIALLTDISLFRHAPHFVKPLVYKRQMWLFSRMVRRALGGEGPSAREAGKTVPKPGAFQGFDRELVSLGLDFKFMNEFLLHAQVGGSRPVFKYYHWNAVHPPLCFDENFIIVRSEFGRAAYTSQAKGCLKMVGLFISKMKALGIYDRTMMIIMSDHGSGRTPDLLVNPQDGPHSRLLDSGNPYREFRIVKSRACSLLLVKPRHSRGPLRTSLAPVSHLDVAPSIFAELGIDAPAFFGRSVFAVPEGSSRERRFLAYNWNGGRDEYLAPLVEYRIVGPCWNDDSWSLTGRVFNAAR